MKLNKKTLRNLILKEIKNKLSKDYDESLGPMKYDKALDDYTYNPSGKGHWFNRDVFTKTPPPMKNQRGMVLNILKHWVDSEFDSEYSFNPEDKPEIKIHHHQDSSSMFVGGYDFAKVIESDDEAGGKYGVWVKIFDKSVRSRKSPVTDEMAAKAKQFLRDNNIGVLEAPFKIF